ncbi:chitinase-3-like protein 1 [Drosophila pseudoobscura]|uniref:Chitinase-3-like protein 1 n=1 Tax=Drosophila pseudoobscura pseudoobscura TaxID=46245 RepID=A0A6I8UHR9_DROPS|nr:chitinase-3-like protein 1 [Drosophila pseudoobscura]
MAHYSRIEDTVPGKPMAMTANWISDQRSGYTTPQNRFPRTLICFSALLSLVVFIAIAVVVCMQLKQGGVSWEEAEEPRATPHRLVCYYSTLDADADADALSLLDVPGDLCTHINIGIASLDNATLWLSPRLRQVLQNETLAFRAAHPQVKLLLWIGGADSGTQFARMVANHAMRKQFLRSLKALLRLYPALDGIDLDWEFPSAYDKDRQHLSQLLYEIRQEWRRERRPNALLSLAVAAPEGIAFYAYDTREINLYADYVNLMAYDFHFYRKDTPFTGLNAPLYAHATDMSIMATFNINYTVHWWLQNGLEPHRLVVGLPTYGHSFTLVSPLNHRIGAPASGYGQCGQYGYTTLSQTCECAARYLKPIYSYDTETCSPYLSGLQEWISYENQTSIACKTSFIKSLKLGGVMVFSLNTDDLRNSCRFQATSEGDHKPIFPLTQAVKGILDGEGTLRER